VRVSQIFLIRFRGLRQFAFAAVCGVSSVLAGQLPAPVEDPPQKFESTIHEVTQIFTVFDRKGNPVAGLERQDFSVSDDGATVNELRAFEQQFDTPLHIAVAIDLSGSVQEKIKYEIDVSTKFLQRVIRPGDDGWIVGFNFVPHLVTDWTQARQILLEVTRRHPGAGTAFYDTAIFACKRLAASGTNSRRRDVLIVISDGEDNTSRSGFSETLETLLRSGVIVLAVYTGYSSPSRELRSLAESTGGKLFYANTKKGVLNGLAKAEQAIRGQYLIAYRPIDFAPDGRFRPVRLRTLRDDLKVRCRRGYYAAASPASPQ
jgi:Ca-activated chloride channel homolog